MSITVPLEGFGGGRALSMELLWENASPTSSFAQQTVNLNLSEYAGIEIVFKAHIARDFVFSTGYIPKDNHRHVLFGMNYILETNSDADLVLRGFALSNSGVVFESGKYNGMETVSDAVAESDKGCIPLKIYGIKGVSN